MDDTKFALNEATHRVGALRDLVETCQWALRGVLRAGTIEEARQRVEEGRKKMVQVRKWYHLERGAMYDAGGRIPPYDPLP